jgi:uncharacterized protein (DUF1800 family)
MKIKLFNDQRVKAFVHCLNLSFSFDHFNHIRMDRRSSLKSLIGQKSTTSTKERSLKRPVKNPILSGLEAYTGNWTHTEAAHLLRRSIFGPTREQVLQAVEYGMETTIDHLLSEQNEPDPPVNYYYQDDPQVPLGETWVNAPYDTELNLFAYRNRSLNAWLMITLYEQKLSIKEKMIVFWHNHFVTADISDPKYDFDYFSTLSQFALGNFRDFVKEITINPSMLRYLNGNQNTKRAPNENYARELLELFTIGKGPLAGPGDYTHYTEEDISEIARALTGWRDRGFRSVQSTPIESFFRSFQHDTGSKKLSHRFDNIEIQNMGEEEYAYLIDVILAKKEVARFISRKLYRWFIYHEIDALTEENVIEPMATLLMDNDYEIKPVIRALLSSQHFYDYINNGCLIKNPLDFVFSVIKTLKVQLPTQNLNPYYQINLLVYNFITQLQMAYGNPPSVSGWKAYYQAPSYYEIWINSVTLPYRMNFTKALSLVGVKQSGHNIIVDVLKLVDELPNPSDINELIDEWVRMLFPQPITEKQINFLKEILIPGLPDYEWTVEYVHYQNNLDDENTVRSMENKLRLLLDAMLSMPEFYLS